LLFGPAQINSPALRGSAAERIFPQISQISTDETTAVFRKADPASKNLR
jgi:hypothetical protein